MLRRFRFLIGVDSKAAGAAAKALPAPSESRSPQSPSLMSEAVQEIAVYIHRFHNLDLFQQGWYQIKVSMRWEDSDEAAPGIPARVVQYEAPGPGMDDTAAVWKINDGDHSFSTCPFRIKFARQDVFLSVMVSFNLAVKVTERFLTSAVLLKFELLYATMQENMSEVQNALDNFSASVHEIRVPPKALLGVHSYCPLHFDTFHTVLVDLSIHVVLLKAAAGVFSQKMFRTSTFSEGHLSGNFHSEFGETNNQALITGETEVDSKDIALWKALCTSRDILLDKLQNLGREINQRIDDLDKTEHVIIQLVKKKLSGHVRGFGNDKVTENEKSMLEGSIDVSSSASEQDHGSFESKNVHWPVVSNVEMLEGFQALGSQLTSIWNAFLRFHRKHKTEIMEYLRAVWAEDRSTEWSMWLVHSKLDIPQQNSANGDVEDNTQCVLVAGKAVSKKPNEDPAVTAASRADLHRKSIEQMKINTHYIQDLQIFGNITQVPVIYVERLIVPCQKVSKSWGFNGALEQAGTSIVPKTARDRLPLKVAGNEPGRNGRALRVVVFVHGFQGHHLDLRLVRNQWLLIDPGAECLMSEANEDKTASDFRELGQRLAEEVAGFLKTKFSSASKIASYGSFRLSFVGHSIGNIIIRTALTDAAMKPYLSNLYTFLSISGPHLGYLYSSNALFNSGLWLFKKLKGSPCMHQLTFTDEADIQNSFLFKLSQEKTLEKFQNIILVSSPQDRYVPYHSARIEMCQAALRDSRKGPSYTAMLKNCLNEILSPATSDRIFIRVDVNFDTSSQALTLNNFIGRAAHIEFLETDNFVRFIMWSFPKLFS